MDAAATRGCVPEPKLVELAENGRTEYALRLVDGCPVLVVVCIGFTIAGLDHEEYGAFEQRMLRFAATLGTLGYPVVGLTFQRRRSKERRHWAEFTCETPEAALPSPSAERRAQSVERRAGNGAQSGERRAQSAERRARNGNEERRA